MISIILIVSLFTIYNNLSDSLKEAFNYLVVGAFTTLISIVSYYLFRLVLEDYFICTILSWICAVLFAYITNRLFVFKSKDKNVLKEFFAFIFSRILSLVFEMLFMFILVDVFKISDKISKLAVQFFIIVLNYVFSKLFVFKAKD